MKWSERIAQGFSPGYDVARRALKVAAEVDVQVVFARQSTDRTPTSGATFRARFSSSNPGLKPWAILLDHFMVKPNQLVFSQSQLVRIVSGSSHLK
jgi:hypothetical protein